jgi:hypothetical protein
MRPCVVRGLNSNRRHDVSRHLFQGRYKAVAVEPDNAGYLEVGQHLYSSKPVARGFDHHWPEAAQTLPLERLSLTAMPAAVPAKCAPLMSASSNKAGGNWNPSRPAQSEK